jgi:hypothetical protein
VALPNKVKGCESAFTALEKRFLRAKLKFFELVVQAGDKQ